MSLAEIVAALIRDPAVAAALRDALVRGQPGDELLSLVRAADLVGVRVRVLTDAGRRGDLKILGPRGARVVRRCELDAWLASTAPKVPTPAVELGEDADRAAFKRSALRLATAIGGGR